MREGAVVVVDAKAPKLEAGPLAKSAIVHVDRDIVVVDKPAGMLSVADEEGNRDTLVHHARTLLRKMGAPGGDEPLGVVHRLDRETSGVMVFTRTAQAKRVLAAAFRAHDIERVYNAIAHGEVIATRAESNLVTDRGDGLRGSKAMGKRAVTHIKSLARLKGATLIECRLETGRQHQIRIHLSELGHPLLGEQVYIRDYRGARIEAPRTMLHARSLGFVHPRSGKRVMFEREPPADFASLVEAIR